MAYSACGTSIAKTIQAIDERVIVDANPKTNKATIKAAVADAGYTAA